MVVRMLAPTTHCQALIDKLHGILMDNRHRIVLLPTLAVIPELEEAEKPAPAEPRSTTAAREELYNTVAEGTHVDSTFVLLIVLSTLVAGIGLVEDNIAVVIGAMVIAPLSGPSLAFAFGVALGDHALMGRALRANADRPRPRGRHLRARRADAAGGARQRRASGAHQRLL